MEGLQASPNSVPGAASSAGPRPLGLEVADHYRLGMGRLPRFLVPSCGPRSPRQPMGRSTKTRFAVIRTGRLANDWGTALGLPLPSGLAARISFHADCCAAEVQLPSG